MYTINIVWVGVKRCEGVSGHEGNIFLGPHYLWVQKVQMNLVTKGRVWVFPSPLNITKTLPSVIEWQTTINKSLPQPQILGQKAKSYH